MDSYKVKDKKLEALIKESNCSIDDVNAFQKMLGYSDTDFLLYSKSMQEEFKMFLAGSLSQKMLELSAANKAANKNFDWFPFFWIGLILLALLRDR